MKEELEHKEFMSAIYKFIEQLELQVKGEQLQQSYHREMIDYHSKKINLSEESEKIAKERIKTTKDTYGIKERSDH